MCQYRYDYYGYCQHQEFILVKLCEDAISLARSDKHQTKHNTEGAIVQAPPIDTTTASLRAAESNLCITKPSIVPDRKVDRSIYPSSTIIHIIVSTMAPESQETRLVPSPLLHTPIENILILDSDHEQEFVQEAERHYNDIISGGKSPAYYKAIEIQLLQVLDRVRELVDPSSSAAVRLQQLHEHNDQSSDQAVSIGPSTPKQIPLDNFPALSLTIAPRGDAPIQSYAKVVMNSLPQPPPAVVQKGEPEKIIEPQPASHVSSVKDEDGDWYVVDRSGRGTRSQKQHVAVTERRTRKTLPQAWLQMNEDAITPEDTSHKSQQRTARVKGPHTQPPQAQVNSLKSKSSKPTLTKTTASKTPGYASPTKASTIRTAGTFDSARSPSPCKSRSMRADTNATITPPDQQLSSRSVASTVSDAARRKNLPAHGKQPVAQIAFGLDGTFESVPASMAQTFSGNSLRPSKKAKLDLRIHIPDPSSSLPRPSSPSRIPIAVPPNSSTEDYERVASGRVTGQTVELTEADRAASKLVDRASILDPIRRRLSSASTTSQGRSSTSSTERQRKDSGAKSLKDMVCVEGDLTEEPNMIQDSGMALAEKDLQAKMQQPPKAVVSSETSALEPASAHLLDTIKQTAETHAVRQMDGQVNGHVAPSSGLEEAQQAGKLLDFHAACQSQHISCASSPEKDPAVLKCVPLQARTSRGHERSSSGPAGFSLRATAAHFVPTPTLQDDFGPLSAPELASSFSVPPASATLSLAPALASAPRLAPTLLSLYPTILSTAVPEISSQQFSTQLPSTMGGYSSWLPDDEWNKLPYETKRAISKERKERGSSSASSPGFASTMFSNFSTSPSLSSMGPIIEPGIELDNPQWDWMQAGQGGVRFGRAPLPTMPEPECDGNQRRGWDVKSAAPGWRYGWRGGDGLEISFKGDGPVAERNPNAPVNFNEYNNDLYGKPTKKGQKYGGRQWSKRNGISPNSRVREWAKNANYPAIPCGNFEVVQAIEHFPYFPNTWCHSCLPGHA
ncbi:hypothetical protein E4T44_05947 [Aureobasidium sp. EXF-8845]|nr:hypothetical protein E4T44_05947 [Aureobasidium sp. EXF-8845]KAI4848920.1 hypothetical protein E4T45_06127 [Aureobasidium sp. EXF-8846]